MRDRRHRLANWCLALAIAGTVAPLVLGHQDLSRPSDRAIEPGDPDVEWLKAILLNLANPADVRKGAAERLLAKETPEAMGVLRDMILGDPALLTPVLGAIDTSKRRPDGLIQPLVRAMSTAPKEFWPALALAVAGYGDVGRDEVIAAAIDRRRSVSERLGPISALSVFHQRPAAQALIGLLGDETAEPREIQLAAMDGLQRMSGMPHGADRDAWHAWWEQVKDQPFDAWLQRMVSNLSTQNAALEKEAESLRQDIAKTGGRFMELYGEIFLTLPAPTRLERLPRLLVDDVAVVRLFALGQIDRMLRNGERVADSLQQKVVERIADVNPQVRARSARLLDDLGYAGASEVIAKAMLAEKNAEVQAAFLSVLANRPSEQAIDAVLRGLNDPAVAEAAAAAAEKLLDARKVAPELVETLVDAARDASAKADSEAVWRLLVRIGTEDDVAEGIRRLDDADAKVRAGAAAGLRVRGLLEPLRLRADDEAIYPALVGGLADGPADLAHFGDLVRLTPTQTMRSIWASAVAALAAKLPTTDLAAADDLLQQAAEADPRLRIAALERAADLSATEGNGTVLALQQRLVGLWLDVAESRRASDLLAKVEALATSPEWVELRFRAAVAGGRYGQAAAIKGDVRSWIDVVSWLAPRDLKAAQSAHEEIARRFGSELVGKLKEDFDAAGIVVSGPAPSVSAVAPDYR